MSVRLGGHRNLMVRDNSAVFGLLYQRRLEAWIERGSIDVDCLEVFAEQFDATTPHHLRWLSDRIPIALRSNRLSLGGPDPLDAGRIAACAALVREAKALWLAHPLGFSRAGEIDLGLTMPIALTATNLDLVCDRVGKVMERCGARLLIEPNSSRLRIVGTLAETEFLNLLCARSGSGLLIDLSVLCAAGRTHQFNPSAWLDDIDLQKVDQLRIGAVSDDGAESAPGPVFEQQLSLVGRVLTRATPRALVLAAPSSWRLEDVALGLSMLRGAVADASGSNRVALP